MVLLVDQEDQCVDGKEKSGIAGYLVENLVEEFLVAGFCNSDGAALISRGFHG